MADNFFVHFHFACLRKKEERIIKLNFSTKWQISSIKQNVIGSQ